MSDTPMKLVVHVSDGTEEYVPLSDSEIQQLELDRIAFATRDQEQKTEDERVAALKESAKAKLIAGEALTEEEAAVLVI